MVDSLITEGNGKKRGACDCNNEVKLEFLSGAGRHVFVYSDVFD